MCRRYGTGALEYVRSCAATEMKGWKVMADKAEWTATGQHLTRYCIRQHGTVRKPIKEDVYVADGRAH